MSIQVRGLHLVMPFFGVLSCSMRFKLPESNLLIAGDDLDEEAWRPEEISKGMVHPCFKYFGTSNVSKYPN